MRIPSFMQNFSALVSAQNRQIIAWQALLNLYDAGVVSCICLHCI
jgi:hypothetical protein